MDKFLCVNCVKHFKDNEEVFIRNQYCTGFCNLLHVKTVMSGELKEVREAMEADRFERKDREAA